ncbi:alpha/beta fold hydrolase [Pedobacter frigoris]|uniref:Alpha/beta fold hydrolase n=1 Tax=Pedobacter frigoris TaxID=2571272 RepID=A0A4U1CC46_9SPHI|nr:alpha/beta fold hydrolase [Pedobacter frigoris]TKC03656.1 alpha/beta fold hydrolase [Pedobacter frigoris]
MKRVCLLFFALLITTSAFSQSVLNLLGKSQDFFKLLSEEKYTEAYGFFDSTFQAKVPEAKIKEIWEKLGEKLGKYESGSVSSSKTEGELFAVVIDVKFTNDSQPFLLAFNKAEKMVGFFLQPKSPVEGYVLPAYADTTLYKEEEVYVKAPGHNLVGLLTTPKKAANYPIVVLVHGSGPSDMDATYGPNKPLKDLALGLAAKGIASIRYVKRTMIYPGEFIGAFTVKEEVMDDALAAIALARTIPGADKKQIYVLGHSLGGMLAPRMPLLAPDLKGIIMVAAPARKLSDMIVEQNKFLFSLMNDTTAAGKKQLDTIVAEYEKGKLTKLGTMKPDSIVAGLPAAYWIDLNVNNQVEAAKKISKQKVFIAHGENDYQVTATDYNIWKAALGTKKNVTLKSYPELNHMLSVHPEKSTPQQYQSPASVFDGLINDISAWIKAK